ncbi:MAG: NAD(+) synthase, partial [Elusimicrobia bacterium]|nr:NAD(+) synthase [Elusimicrobiota bacterium]
IGGLYKTEVYELAKYLNVPGQIIAAPPTAGFFKGQTDEGELGMNYEKLDSILKHLERGEKGESPIYDKDEVVKVKSLIKKSAHKRDEIPVPDLDRE